MPCLQHALPGHGCAQKWGGEQLPAHRATQQPHTGQQRGCTGGSRGGQRRAAERGSAELPWGCGWRDRVTQGCTAQGRLQPDPRNKPVGTRAAKGAQKGFLPPPGPARCHQLSRSTRQQPAQHHAHLTAAHTGWRLPAPTGAQPHRGGLQPPAWCRASPPKQGPPRSLPPAPRAAF